MFEYSVNSFMDKLIKKGIFFEYLNDKNLIISDEPMNKRDHYGKISNSSFGFQKPNITISDLELGSHKRLDVPLTMATC